MPFLALSFLCKTLHQSFVRKRDKKEGEKKLEKKKLIKKHVWFKKDGVS